MKGLVPHLTQEKRRLLLDKAVRKTEFFDRFVGFEV